MATKSALTTALNGFISAVVNITKHRNANNAIVNEIYPTVYIENETTNVVLDQVTAQIDYDFKIWKQGRTVFIEGFFRNTGLSILSSPIIADIIIPEFETTSTSTTINCFAPNGTTIQIEIVNGEIKVSNNLSFARYYVNGSYPTLN